MNYSDLISIVSVIISLVSAIISIIISLVSAIIAFSLYRLNMKQVSGDVLYRIIERLESPAMREIRRAIYALERDRFLEWDDEMRRKVDTWGAELDVVSTLLSQEGDITAFFLLYGDVILRSIYQTAPYGNYQRTIRGRQFWLPLERFGSHMLKTWKRSVRQGIYNPVIGLPNWPKIGLSHDTFFTDKDCQYFMQKRG